MSTYVYESKRGKRIEREFRIGKAPRRVKVRGVPYDLTICPPRVINVSKDVSCIARTVPQWTPGAKRYVTDPKSEDYGQPVVETLREHRNIQAATDGRHVYRYRTDR